MCLTRLWKKLLIRNYRGWLECYQNTIRNIEGMNEQQVSAFLKNCLGGHYQHCSPRTLVSLWNLEILSYQEAIEKLERELEFVHHAETK